VSEFLEDFEFHLSPHYSGRAGYCRLFLYKALENVYLSAINSFIAIESDQLFFDDVSNLFADSIDSMTPSEVVAAPEMYMPWDLVFEDQKKRRREQEENGVEIVNPPHNGLIGGIMAFDLVKIRLAYAASSSWEGAWMNELREFVKVEKTNNNIDWTPRLNDQDVFNAVFSRRTDWLRIIPCKWNLQYHAAMNSARLCGETDDGSIYCDKAKEKGIFLCKSRPSVVHFMAGSYKKVGRSFYYSIFWAAYEEMDLGMVGEGIAETTQ